MLCLYLIKILEIIEQKIKYNSWNRQTTYRQQRR